MELINILIILAIIALLIFIVDKLIIPFFIVLIITAVVFALKYVFIFLRFLFDKLHIHNIGIVAKVFGEGTTLHWGVTLVALVITMIIFLIAFSQLNGIGGREYERF